MGVRIFEAIEKAVDFEFQPSAPAIKVIKTNGNKTVVSLRDLGPYIKAITTIDILRSLDLGTKDLVFLNNNEYYKNKYFNVEPFVEINCLFSKLNSKIFECIEKGREESALALIGFKEWWAWEELEKETMNRDTEKHIKDIRCDLMSLGNSSKYIDGKLFELKNIDIRKMKETLEEIEEMVRKMKASQDIQIKFEAEKIKWFEKIYEELKAQNKKESFTGKISKIIFD